MTVQLTPNGTRGSRVPKLPRFSWRIIHPVLNLLIRLNGGKLLELTTVSFKSGREHTVPLSYFPDGQDRWLIIASFGGSAKHPGWYVNMTKNPDKIWIRIGNEKLKVRAESLHGTARTTRWQKIVTVAPVYAEYQTKTDREIPLVLLVRA